MGYREATGIPDLGVGVGLRLPHRGRVLHESGGVTMDWFEVLTENFLVRGGRPRAALERLRGRHRLVPHGVSLAIGSVEPLDEDYLGGVKRLADGIDAPWVSDHLAWGRVPGVHFHDLLPLPYTREAVIHVVERVKRVQGVLGRPFALENVSSYLTWESSVMAEHELLAEVAERADCGILLDCNNVYVSAENHGFDPGAYIDALPADRVVQIHLAGHTDRGRYLLDTHAGPVADPVWSLYRRAIARFGSVSTLIEWDDAVPEWETLEAEAARAREVRSEVLAR